MDTTGLEEIRYSTVGMELGAVYAMLPAAVLTIYDYILTFPHEINHIWRRKFTGATALFLVTRYLTLAKVFLLFRSTWSDDVSICATSNAWFDIFLCIVSCAEGMFNTLRIFAIWDQNWLPTLVVLTLSLVTPACNIYRVSKASVLSQIDPLPLPIGGCLINIGMSFPRWQKLRIISRTVAIGTDGLIVILTWIRTYGIYKSSGKAGIQTVTGLLLRDGTIYFGTLVIINALMIGLNDYISQSCALPTMSIQVAILLYIWPTTFNSILISRFLLNVRVACSEERQENSNACTVQGPRRVSSSRIMGDIGGDLEHTYDDVPPCTPLLPSLGLNNGDTDRGHQRRMPQAQGCAKIDLEYCPV